MTPSDIESELFWDQLVDLISQGRVIPIVGPDLLTVQYRNETLPLYTHLAKLLRDGLSVQAGDAPPPSLNQIASQFIESGTFGDPKSRHDMVYAAVNKAMPTEDQIPVPESLLKLARITPLNLFVTTTFDNLLQRAIKQVRQGEPVSVIRYSLREIGDLPPDIPRLSELKPTTVFHLMGSLSATPNDYAVTEEDTLEFVHLLQSEVRSPRNLLTHLKDNHVLLIGSGFSDWLARFFLRVVRHDRLWMAPGNALIADGGVLKDQNLLDFLRRFSSGTRVMDRGAAEFVDELFARWTARTGTTDTTRSLPEAAVFISYPKEDRAAAESIRAALESADLKVWYDRDQLEVGDDWLRKIRRNVRDCSVFVPVISPHVLDPQGRFFREEWAAAEAEARRRPPTPPLVLPVRLPIPVELGDKVDAVMPEIFKTAQQGVWSGDGCAKFVAKVKEIYRQYQTALQEYQGFREAS